MVIRGLFQFFQESVGLEKKVIVFFSMHFECRSIIYGFFTFGGGEVLGQPTNNQKLSIIDSHSKCIEKGNNIFSTFLKFFTKKKWINPCSQVPYSSVAFVIPTGPYPQMTMIVKQLKMEGFMQSRWEPKHPESLRRLMGWLKEVCRWQTRRHSISCRRFSPGNKDWLLFASHRVNCRAASTSPKALKTCRRLLWTCYEEKTLAKLLWQSDVKSRKITGEGSTLLKHA